jgi:hypothetical protein
MSKTRQKPKKYIRRFEYLNFLGLQLKGKTLANTTSIYIELMAQLDLSHQYQRDSNNDTPGRTWHLLTIT